MECFKKELTDAFSRDSITFDKILDFMVTVALLGKMVNIKDYHGSYTSVIITKSNNNKLVYVIPKSIGEVSEAFNSRLRLAEGK